MYLFSWVIEYLLNIRILYYLKAYIFKLYKDVLDCVF